MSETIPPYLYDRSGTRYSIEEPRWRGDDSSPLMISDLSGIDPADIDTGERSQWRYRAALPVDIQDRVTLGEGCTPMLTTNIGGIEVKVKPEWFNPTASFKDRGSSVMVSILRSHGITSILEDSSGNGGSSVAAYAAAAGMHAKILAPASTSANKILQSRFHNAEIELVPGTRDETAAEALRQSEQFFYASHNWHPYFLQGVKLIAYEIWEDLGFEAPENIIVPAGAGSLVLGCSIGFGELLRAGQIARLPRILVAQPEHCSPLARAHAISALDAVERDWKPTIAEGTSIARPVRGPEVLAAVRASGGTFQTVAEGHIAPAVRELASRGLYAEPTSAVAAAAVPGFAAQGFLAPDERTVMVLTGSALKAADKMAQILN
ncbi:pyridoxal-5'-phosphate-dependent protein subunit beta [Pseudarthrobacter sulfonivorans]|uniref:Pyridoxal-5'-phosphate-dependent protein subunit beta n=1 Tax=Pseudarthrobacter sulfonivorans TaxID=121292 RepID=A0A0U3PAP0_9MICC|nr:pyridoxal-phosphate dependent enzyme [Pseudarthrobacter sulfonivorans]ALV41395.1 pyridoxal-5'-phosphate-dependent protein subunit beta [Pseudarthrobacter sulfonivorans]